MSQLVSTIFILKKTPEIKIQQQICGVVHLSSVAAIFMQNITKQAE